MDKASKFLALFIISTSVVEAVGTFCAFQFDYSSPIYNFSAPFRFFFICLYFNYATKFFHKNRIGISIGIISFLVAVLNFIFLQNPFDYVCNNFLAYEAVVSTLLSLGYFYNILLVDEPLNKTHFLFSSLLLIFWSFSFLHWLLLLDVYNTLIQQNISLIVIMNFTISSFTYCGIGIIFLLQNRFSDARE